MRMDRKPTIKDLATATGVSKTTVSFAFNAPEKISKETCARILAVAKEMGYIPDPAARNFNRREHRALGFLLPQEIEFTLGNPYINQVILGVGSVCQEKGFSLTLIPPINHSISEAVKDAAVDGIITMGMHVADQDIRSVLETRRIPYVTIDGSDNSNTLPSVNVDDEKAMYDLTSLVLARGHRNIAVISLSKDAFSTDLEDGLQIPQLRAIGVLRALREHGIEEEAISKFTSQCTIEEGYETAGRILALSHLPTAVITSSDIVAVGAIQRFQASGLLVPEDISVTGFDNIPLSQVITPALTTVDQPGDKKGREAARILFETLESKGNAVKHITIPYSIIIRSSLGDAKR